MSAPKGRPIPSSAHGAPALSSATNGQQHRHSKSQERPQESAAVLSQSSNGNPRLGTSSTAEGNMAAGSSSTAVQFDGSVNSSDAQKKKGKHRGGKKKRNRRKSFAAPADPDRLAEEGESELESSRTRPNVLESGPSRTTRSDQDRERQRESFYRLGRGMLSSESLESEALLDHRDQAPLRTRRQSVQGLLDRRNTPPSPHSRASRLSRPGPTMPENTSRSRLYRSHRPDDDGDNEGFDDHTPLVKARKGTSGPSRDYGGLSNSFSRDRGSRDSSRSSRVKKRMVFDRDGSTESQHSYDVNNPPSMPGSPKLGADVGYDDVMLMTHEAEHSRSPENRRATLTARDALIDIDAPTTSANVPDSSPPSPGRDTSASAAMRHRTSVNPAEGDVCFPQEGMSDIGEEDFASRMSETETQRQRRRRSRKKWPDLSYLEEWSLLEKEGRTMEGIRSRKVSEPLYIGGRLRPSRATWHREEEDAPYRFTYFNETFPSTIHAQTISELLQDGQTFKDLFVPEPPELTDTGSDESEDEDEQNMLPATAMLRIQQPTSVKQEAAPGSSRPSSVLGKVTPPGASEDPSRQQSPSLAETSTPKTHQRQSSQKPKRYGQRPVFWLDVLSPTDAEMRVLSKAFNIHPLTAEDILMQEEREKVELFRNYYFVSYRTFEQDTNSDDYLEPVNMYVVVFGEGVISFHFSQTPHPANVRRRIRQLTDYLIVTSDWISYAIIDDITDAYAPLIQKIENEVDTIDEIILGMHETDHEEERKNMQARARFKKSRKALRRCCNPLVPFSRTKPLSEYDYEDIQDSDSNESFDEKVTANPSKDMLRRTGEVRKRVMGLYRLLGTKADVIKGFAKRCNEQWEVAPRNEIGLYLGDIQDHIVTMTSNLSHYENLLSRAHSNYLAQINVGMNERAERTNDILGKLTVVGTIVLPMNIITGLWGMNCLVPGQDVESLTWFFCLTGGLVMFGVVCFMVAKRVYGIV